jgi:sortase A
MSRSFLAIILATAGAILFGQGIYIHAKAMLAQVLLQRAFAETITTGHAVKPWPWADTWPDARITVGRLGASAIALAGSSGQALAFGPGHVERTADAGERGVAVYSAHRDTHFRFLKDVAIGDEIDVTRHDGKTFRYRADDSSIVRFDQSGIDPFTTGHELVLTTCWPFDAITHGPALRPARDDDFTGDVGGTILPAVIAMPRRCLYHVATFCRWRGLVVTIAGVILPSMNVDTVRAARLD